MEEIEIKILDTKHEDLEPKLISLGAKKIFDDELYAVFFDTENSIIKNSNQTFRLRKEGTKTYMTHKKKIPSKSAKIRDEIEIEVSNFDDTKKIISALGFKEICSLKKTRVSYKLNDVKFEFDTFQGQYDFIPEFLEIEAKDIDTLYKYVKLLGFSKKDCKPWSGKDIIKHYS